MSDPAHPSRVRRGIGWLLLLAGAAVFLIRLQHAGPYAFPERGNLLAAGVALLVGIGLARGRAAGRLTTALGWLALVASPVVLYFALYATLSELEEVVVLKTTDPAADLRLWIVDRGDAAWVTMPRWKADAHGLSEARVELLRRGELRCVVATRHEDRATVNEIHRLRHEKYAVQRLATAIGLFGRTAGEETVALRLDPCPSPPARAPDG